MIWLDALSKSFGKGERCREVFSEVNLLIPSGPIVGIVGERGSGKSTLLRLIAGVELPDRGHVHIEGMPLWSGGIGMSQHPLMTVRQNLRFLCRLYTEEDMEMEDHIEKILELSELIPYRNMLWKDVPVTHKPRLKFAVMAVLKSDVLLLDGLPNPKKESEIHEMLQQRMKEVSTLIALPNLKSLRRYCDAGIVIHKNRLHYFDRIKEAIKYYRKEISE